MNNAMKSVMKPVMNHLMKPVINYVMNYVINFVMNPVINTVKNFFEFPDITKNRETEPKSQNTGQIYLPSIVIDI